MSDAELIALRQWALEQAIKLQPSTLRTALDDADMIVEWVTTPEWVGVV
jgi:hypothetical protein